jgi:hypothetical protein
MSSVGQALFSFFEGHLKVQKGFRPGSAKSYRETLWDTREQFLSV